MRTFGFLLLLLPCLSLAQQGTPLFADGLQGWTLQNAKPGSFAFDEGVLRVSGSQGWLQSSMQYGDFELRGQVRFVEADSDSGIFLRVEPGTDFILGWPGDAYQVQMREISVNSSDNPLPLANLYRHRVAAGETRYQRERVFERYTGVGEWQDIVIHVEGTRLWAELNGERVLEAEGLENAQGHIGFQSEKGVIEYRYMVLHAL